MLPVVRLRDLRVLVVWLLSLLSCYPTNSLVLSLAVLMLAVPFLVVLLLPLFGFLCQLPQVARAVAQSLYSKNSMDVGKVGGAFISLKASDVVRPEVGNSEKMIVSAFETARSNAPSVVFIDEFQVSLGFLFQTNIQFVLLWLKIIYRHNYVTFCEGIIWR